MTCYRVFKSFSGPVGRLLQRGEVLTDPPWPAANLKALVSTRYLEVITAPPPASIEPEPRRRRAS